MKLWNCGAQKNRHLSPTRYLFCGFLSLRQVFSRGMADNCFGPVRSPPNLTSIWSRIQSWANGFASRADFCGSVATAAMLNTSPNRTLLIDMEDRRRSIAASGAFPSGGTTGASRGPRACRVVAREKAEGTGRLTLNPRSSTRFNSCTRFRPARATAALRCPWICRRFAAQL